MKGSRAYIAVIMLLFSFVSCKDEQDTYVTNYHYDYFPVDTGHYVIYDVDSIQYSYVAGGNANRDTIRYQWMELISDTFYDNLNQLTYRLECYRRANDQAGWSIDRVWHVRTSTTTVEKVEGDLRFVKLVFPPVDEASWNGNIF